MSKSLTPIRTIREKCLDCSGNQWSEVSKCGAVACPLWPYRHGKRPTFPDTEKHLQAKAVQDEGNRQQVKS